MGWGANQQRMIRSLVPRSKCRVLVSSRMRCSCDRAVSFASRSLVAFKLWEQLVESAVACLKWWVRGVVVVAEAAPSYALSQRWEHLTSSSGWSAVEQSEVIAVAFIDIHRIVCEGLVELSAGRGMCGAARSSGIRVWCDLLWEGVVVEVEPVVASQVVRRNSVIERAAIELEAGGRRITRVPTIIAHGWCHWEARKVDVVEVKVHIEVTSKVG